MSEEMKRWHDQSMDMGRAMANSMTVAAPSANFAANAARYAVKILVAKMVGEPNAATLGIVTEFCEAMDASFHRLIVRVQSISEATRAEHLQDQAEMDRLVEAQKKAHEIPQVELLKSAIDRSPFDLTNCKGCGLPVVALPDGLPFCEVCGKNED